ncbi:MAG: TadE family protein [Actinomycetota bacterium]|nr:TadE family protein [Actinomycetota bacterium]
MAVEAAIITPLIVLLFFGILEFGLLFRSTLTFSNAVRSGVRTAVALPRVDGYEISTAQAVAAALDGIGDDSVDTLTVYRADPDSGEPVTGDFDTCSTDCWRFDWNPATREFVPIAGTGWPASEQAACGSEEDTDFLGVHIKGKYSFVTGFFGVDQTLTERSIMRLEPLPLSAECSP